VASTSARQALRAGKPDAKPEEAKSVFDDGARRRDCGEGVESLFVVCYTLIAFRRLARLLRTDLV